MTYTQSATRSASYTTTDVGNVVRRFTTDLKMMGTSSETLSESKAADYGHDVETLAAHGYLNSVDVTLLNSLGSEVRACRYTVDENTGSLKSSRPGGVLWPATAGGRIRLVLNYKSHVTDAMEQALPLKTNWVWGVTDTSHKGLKSSGGRDYTSGGYGLHREDWS